MTSLAAYERISSIDRGLTDVRPRSVFTITGKKQRTAAIAIFEKGFSSPNQLFVIGANAMIGIALAATANGIKRVGRARGSAPGAIAARMPRPEPEREPAGASLKVYSP